LDGTSFRYLAEPLQILKGRTIALVFLAVYYFSGLISPIATGITIIIIAALAPAMVVMSMSFQLRNTSYRNIKFNFRRDYKRAYKVFALPLLLFVPYFLLLAYMGDNFQAAPQATDSPAEMPSYFYLLGLLPLLIGALFPLWQYMIIKFKTAHAHFGKFEFSFTGTAGRLYGIYLSTLFGIMLIGIIAVIIFSGFGALFSSDNLDASAINPIFIQLIGFIIIIPVYLWMFAYIHTKKTNFIYGNLCIDNHRVKSDLKVKTMLFLYVTNTLAIAISLGLLMPWAKMTSLVVVGDLNDFIGAQPEGQSAFGEEMGEVFDMDLGL